MNAKYLIKKQNGEITETTSPILMAVCNRASKQTELRPIIMRNSQQIERWLMDEWLPRFNDGAKINIAIGEKYLLLPPMGGYEFKAGWGAGMKDFSFRIGAAMKDIESSTQAIEVKRWYGSSNTLYWDATMMLPLNEVPLFMQYLVDEQEADRAEQYSDGCAEIEISSDYFGNLDTRAANMRVGCQRIPYPMLLQCAMIALEMCKLNGVELPTVEEIAFSIARGDGYRSLCMAHRKRYLCNEDFGDIQPEDFAMMNQYFASLRADYTAALAVKQKPEPVVTETAEHEYRVEIGMAK